MLLHLLLAQQALIGSPASVCDAVDRLIGVDVTIGAECRLVGEWLPATPDGDLPYDRLTIDGVSTDAIAALRRGLDTFVRVATPLAEVNARGSVRSALSSFSDAIEREPTLYEAAVVAAELALRTRQESDMRRALDVVRRTRNSPPRLSVLAAELQVALGDLDPVRSADDDLLRDPAYRRVHAIALLLSEDADDQARGDSLYFSALQAGGETVLPRAVADLGPLGDGWHPRDASSIEVFWSRLALEAGVDRPERLGIHFRRLHEAYAAYYDWPRIAMRTSPDEVASLFDRRGSIFLRHGSPMRIVHTLIPGQIDHRYETWVYDGRWGSPFVVHFIGANRSWHFTGAAPCGEEKWLLERGELDPRFGHLYIGCVNPTQENWRANQVRYQEVNRDIREAHVAALRSQSVDLGLRILLSARLSMHRMRDEQGRPELLLVGAVPIGSGSAEGAGEGQAFTLGLTAHVVDSIRGLRAANSLTASTSTIADPGYASIPVVLPAPASGALIRVILRDVDSTHVGAGLSGLAPAPLSADDRMSDLIMLSVDGPSTIVRYGMPVSPTPDVVGGARFGLYFELYGLEVEEYRATIRARRSDAGVLDRLLNRDEVLSLSLTRRPNVVRPGVAAEKLIVAAPDWEPGEYELEVEIEADGERITRYRALRVVVND